MAKEVEKKSGSAPDLLREMAEANGLDATKYFKTLVKTVLKKKDRNRNDVEPSHEEVYAFLMVCKRYNLDPFLKQIHGFVGRDGQIQPMVGVDGWIRMVNQSKDYVTHRTTLVLQCTKTKATVTMIENPDSGARDMFFDPPEARPDLNDCKEVYAVTAFKKKGSDEWLIGDAEWYSECKRDTDPWRQMPRRMLGHKSYIQAARKFFGFSGLLDEDEAREAAGPQFIEGSARRAPDRAAIDTQPESETAKELSGPSVAAGNVDEHTGHDGELGAAQEAASEVRDMQETPDQAPEPKPEPKKEPEPPSLPDPDDDPGKKLLGELEDSSKYMKRVHAARSDAGYTVKNFNLAWKPVFGLKSLKDLHVSRVPELVAWIKDNPWKKPEPETEVQPEKEKPEPDPEPEKPADDQKQKQGVYNMEVYRDMVPDAFGELYIERFGDRPCEDLSIEEIEKFLVDLEELVA